MRIGHSRFAKVEELRHIGIRSSHDEDHLSLMCHNLTIAGRIQQNGDEHAL